MRTFALDVDVQRMNEINFLFFFSDLKHYDKAWIKIDHCCERGGTVEGRYVKIIQAILSRGTGGQHELHFYQRL